MASNIYTQVYVDGTSKKVRRIVKQGRKTSGLGKPFLQKLYADDEEALLKIKDKLGYLYNKNEFVSIAVKFYINNAYMELLKQ
jgi:hypothetical protein